MIKMIDSLFVNLLFLLPTGVIAVFVEKYYTSYWIGFWNLFAVFVTGVAMFVAPIIHTPLYNDLWSSIPMILIAFGGVGMVMSYFVSPEIARKAGSGKLTAAILVAVYVFQTFNNPTFMQWSFFGTLGGLFILKYFIH